MGSVPGLGRSPGEGNGNPLQYLAWESPQRSLVGYSPWDRKTVRHNLVTKQQKHSCFTMLSFLLYSKVNQSHINTNPLFFRFPSPLGHHRALSRVPCASQQVLISYLIYTQYCIYVSLNLPFHPTDPSPTTCGHQDQFFQVSTKLLLSLQYSNKVP